MRKTFWSIVIVLLVVLAAVNALLLIPPTGYARRVLVQEVKEATGLDLSIRGPVSLRLLPRFSLTADNVALRNPDRPGSGDIVTADAIRIVTDTWSLLRGSRRLESVQLIRPNIVAAVDAAGRPSWLPAPVKQGARDSGWRDAGFNETGPGRLLQQAQITGSGQRSGTSRAGDGGVSVGAVTMTDGTIAFTDLRRGLSGSAKVTAATLRDVTAEGAGALTVTAAQIALDEVQTRTAARLVDAEVTASGVRLTGRLDSAGVTFATATVTSRAEEVVLSAGNGDLAARGLTPDGIAQLKVVAATLTVRDDSSEVEAALETAEGTLDAIGPASLGRLQLKANRARIGAGTSRPRTALTGLDMEARGVAGTGIADVRIDAAGLEAVEPRSGMSIRARSASTRLGAIAPERIGGIVISAAGLDVHTAAGAVAVATRNAVLSVAEASIVAQSLRNPVLKAQRLTVGGPVRGPMAGASAGAQPIASDVVVSTPALELGKPVELALGFQFDGDAVSGTARLPAPEAMVLGSRLPAAVVLDAANAKLALRGQVSFDGSATGADLPLIDARVEASATSLERVARWFGYALAEAGKGAVRLEGDVKVDRRRLALSNARIEHSGQVVTGSLALETGGDRPRLSGRLAADRLDADRYLALVATPPTRSRGAAAAGAPAAVRAEVSQADFESAMRDDIKAYLQAVLAQPVVRGRLDTNVEVPSQHRTRAGVRAPDASAWDGAPLPVQGLRALDLDVDWSIGVLKLRGLDVKVPSLKTRLANGALRMEAPGITTGNGRIAGTALLDAGPAVPTLTTRLTADGVDAFELMRALGSAPMLAGLTSMTADLATAGASAQQMVAALSGTVTARIDRAGSIVGYDLTSIWSLLGLISNRQYDSSRRTPFDTLTARLAFDKGVARDSTVTIAGRAIAADGNGTVRLPEQNLDYRAQVKLQAWYKRLAVKLFGGWSDIQFGLDMPGYASNPEGLLNPGEVFPGLFGDPELARLAGAVLSRAGPRGLEPGFARFLGDLGSQSGSPAGSLPGR